MTPSAPLPPPEEPRPKIWGTRSNFHATHTHDHHHIECAYAITVTRRWFVGFTTLLHSLVRHSGESDMCGILFLGHSSLPDSALTESELQLVTQITGTKPIIWHEVNATRLQWWRSVPYIREGGIMAWLKLELFYLDTHQPRSVIYLDTDMLILDSLTFVHDYLRKPDEKEWTIYGSGNWYGVNGWLFTAETTPSAPAFINTGFLAFRPPATASFQQRLDERVKERITKRLKLFLADQDVVNTALSRGPGNEMLVRRDWHANYRPPNNASVATWRIAHWMGVVKPWGQRGHTDAPVRYNDQALPLLDTMWRDECAEVALKAKQLGGGGGGGVTINCGKPFVRNVPQRLEDSVYYFLLLGLILVALIRLLRVPCREYFGHRCANAAAVVVFVLYAFAAYLDAEWDQAAWIRLMLPASIGGRGERL